MAWIKSRPGRGCWYIYWNEGGRRRGKSTRIPVGQPGGRDAAEALAREKERQLAGGGCRPELIRAVLEDVFGVVEGPGGVRVVDLRTAYERAEIKSSSSFTAATRAAQLGRFVGWIAKTHPKVAVLSQVTPRICAQYLDAAFADAAGNTWNNNRSTLLRAFRVLGVEAGLEKNPWEMTVRREARSVRKEAFSPAQVTSLLGAAEGFRGRCLGFWPPAILLGYYQGLRLHDVCTLERGEVDFARGVIQYVPEKNRRRRPDLLVRGLHPEQLKLLEPIAPVDGYFWPDVARAYDAKSRWITEEFSALCELCGIPTSYESPGRRNKVVRFGFHSLRHAHVTQGLRAGIPRDVMVKSVGHGSPAMTDIYDHNNDLDIVSQLPTV